MHHSPQQSIFQGINPHRWLPEQGAHHDSIYCSSLYCVLPDQYPWANKRTAYGESQWLSVFVWRENFSNSTHNQIAVFQQLSNHHRLVQVQGGHYSYDQKIEILLTLQAAKKRTIFRSSLYIKALTAKSSQKINKQEVLEDYILIGIHIIEGKKEK